MFFSVVITVYERDQIFLPRAMTCLLNQTCKDFELIVVVDGETSLRPYDPEHVCINTFPTHLVYRPPTQVIYRPRSNTFGYRERHHALELAQGEYIVWLNADNLVYPDWLLYHYQNVAESRGAISLVNIQYWLCQDYWGVMPRALAMGSLDLLNYALPLHLARLMDVFGADTERIHFADWIAFERCASVAPVVWIRDQPVCACHF